MDKPMPSDALQHIGLSKYAAETLIGLQKLGPATASDIAEVTDVPRSQVYGAVDELEQMGLVDIQGTNPKIFAAVKPETVGQLLQTRLDRQMDIAITGLQKMESTTREKPKGADQEYVWRAQGSTAISERVTALTKKADDQLHYYCETLDSLSDEIRTQLSACAEDAVAVSVYTSPDAEESFQFGDTDSEGVSEMTASLPPSVREQCTRLLVVDHRAVLVGIPVMTPQADERCFWSANAQISTVLATAIEALLADASSTGEQ